MALLRPLRPDDLDALLPLQEEGAVTARSTWGSGLAGRVHDEVVAVIAAQGHRAAWLRVFRENRRAVRFYERRGWRPTGEVSTSSFAPYPTLVRFERDLG